MNLQIIGGEFRGRKLHSPKGDQTRPSSGLVRKALFDICRELIPDANFLDLFAGSGAVGIEALSRGAKSTTFVDKSPLACRCIKENIALLSLQEVTKVFCQPIERALDYFKAKKCSFDLIYIDPPYGKNFLPPILQQIAASNILNVGGRIFAEESEKGLQSSLELGFLPLEFVEKRKYGNSILLEYRRIE